MGHLSPVGVQAAQHYWTKHVFFSNIQEVKDNSFCFEKPETSSFYEPQSTTQYLPNSNGNRHVGKWWGVGGSLIQSGNPTAFAIAFPGACRDQTQTMVSFAPLKRSSPQGGGVCSPIKSYLRLCYVLHDKCIFTGPLLWKKNRKKAGYVCGGFFSRCENLVVLIVCFKHVFWKLCLRRRKMIRTLFSFHMTLLNKRQHLKARSSSAPICKFPPPSWEKAPGMSQWDNRRDRADGCWAVWAGAGCGTGLLRATSAVQIGGTARDAPASHPAGPVLRPFPTLCSIAEGTVYTFCRNVGWGF